jgi:hypothetical protein
LPTKIVQTNKQALSLNYYNIEKWPENSSLPSESSILSHSSRMKCLTFFNGRSLSLARARILPGVPTTI